MYRISFNINLNLTLCRRLAKNLKGIIGEFVYYGAPISISNRLKDISTIFLDFQFEECKKTIQIISMMGVRTVMTKFCYKLGLKIKDLKFWG